MVGLPYPVTIAQGSLDRIADVVRSATPAHRVAIITDSEVGRHYASRAQERLGSDTTTLTIPSGEQHKTRETWASLTDRLVAGGFGRDTTIVALGGGVVGDIAGFVAATYMRGVPVVQVPTTLLAMVDASIGGKTGVDTPAGKNLVGAFHQPAAVLIDPALLQTLRADYLRAGFAEIVKHGVVTDAEYFQRTRAFAERWTAGGHDGLEELTVLIEGSIRIKASIVSRDERESGLRKVLNFGHTIGHAIEAATQFQILHGHAVAIGMVAEARIAELLGIAAAGTASAIADVCRAAELSTSVPDIPVATLLEFARADKKARGGRVEYALPIAIGAMAGGDHGWSVPVDDTTVRKALGP